MICYLIKDQMPLCCQNYACRYAKVKCDSFTMAGFIERLVCVSSLIQKQVTKNK